MTKSTLTNTVSVAALTVVPVPLVNVTLETASAFSKAIASAFASNATAHAKADRDLLGNTVKAARLIGVPISEAQWAKQFASGARKACEARKLAEISSALSRAKAVTLCVLSGIPELQPVAGQTINTFLAAVRPLMGEAKLPDGQWLLTRNEDGTPKPKAGAKQGAKGPKSDPAAPAGSAGESAKAEGGTNRSPEFVAARQLMGSDALAAKLVLISGNFRDEFALWADGILAEAEAAKAVLGTNGKVRTIRAPTVTPDASAVN